MHKTGAACAGYIAACRSYRLQSSVIPQPGLLFAGAPVITHTLHAYIEHHPNVAIYGSPMESMGYGLILTGQKWLQGTSGPGLKSTRLTLSR